MRCLGTLLEPHEWARSLLPLEWASATLPKANTSVSENEDAIAAAPAGGRFAVADGASEGWQSGPWAQHLVKAYVRRPPSPADFDAWLKSVRDDWKPPSQSGPAAWYAEMKEEQGSFATVLGVQFAVSKTGLAWKAVAVGDSCLFLIRSANIFTAFPVESVKRFGNKPGLVPSSIATRCPEPDWLAGKAGSGDLFLLGTDSVSAGLFRRADPGLWNGIRAAVKAKTASSRTAGLLEFLKDFRALQNDDVSLLVVLIPDQPELSP